MQLPLLAVIALSPLVIGHEATGSPQGSDPIPAADPAILAETLSQHVHSLASDAMQGRMTGAPETKVAARYIADVLAKAKISPAGDDGTYFQRVPLIAFSFEENPTLLVEESDGTTWTAKQGPDFRLRVRGAPDGQVRLLVRSVTAVPEEDKLRGTALFVPGKRTAFAQTLADLELGGGEGLGLLLMEGSRREGRARAMRGSDLATLKSGADPSDRLTANGRLLEALQAGRVTAVTLHAEAQVEDRSCQNVIGILPGTGTPEQPELAQQVVVLSAHYDHIGVKTQGSADSDSDEDVIYNGADDDASGVAAVLELAEAFGAGKRPVRTLLVFLATGEERGLLGTSYYLDNPVVPLEETFYNLNLEMIGRPDELLANPGDLWLTGWDETTLGDSLAGEGQPVSKDPRPEQNFYQRSDNIAFVRRGIMGQTLSSYGMHTDYHHVSDEADSLDYAHMEAATKNAHRVAYALLVDAIPVSWGK